MMPAMSEQRRAVRKTKSVTQRISQRGSREYGPMGIISSRVRVLNEHVKLLLSVLNELVNVHTPAEPPDYYPGAYT